MRRLPPGRPLPERRAELTLPSDLGPATTCQRLVASIVWHGTGSRHLVPQTSSAGSAARTTPPYGAPRGAVGVFTGPYGAPRGAVGVFTGPYGAPRGAVGVFTGRFRKEAGECEAPHGQCPDVEHALPAAGTLAAYLATRLPDA